MLKLFKKKTADPKEELKAVLGDYELPSFPAIVMSALERIRDEDASLSSIADLMSSDPGLTVRLLGTVNSAAFGLKHTVRNIHHAVSLMGRNQLESMLISMAVGQSLPQAAAEGYDSSRFWTTSAQRATTARALSDLLDPSASSESFTAGLLQDLAIPILAHSKGEEYGRLLEEWHEGGEDLASSEAQLFGWNHAWVGSWLCQEWSFPEKLTLAIGAHHGGGDEEEDEGLPAASLVASLREVDHQRGIEQLVESARDHYGIPSDQTAGLIESSFEAAEEIARLFA
jgi:HD-like signal output (HDOD) protein